MAQTTITQFGAFTLTTAGQINAMFTELYGRTNVGPGGSSTQVQYNNGGAFGGFGSWNGSALGVDRLVVNAPSGASDIVKIIQANDTPFALTFENATTPSAISGFFTNNDGSVGFNAATALALQSFAGDLELQASTNIMITAPTIQATGTFINEIEFSSTRLLAATVLDGTNAAALLKLGGTAESDIFLLCQDGGPGVDDNSVPRFFNMLARNATASHPVSSVSFTLDGWFWNGSASVQKALEIGNVVRTTGNPELWLQQISGGSGHPFLRMFWDQSVTGILATHDQNTFKLALQAYDVDGTAYKTFILLTAGNTPDCTIAPPAGGTVTVQATTYKSSDGTSGVSAGPFTTITGITVKNGLVTALTGS